MLFIGQVYVILDGSSELILSLHVYKMGAIPTSQGC